VAETYGRAKSRSGVPTRLSRETSGITTNCRAFSNICERFVAFGIKPWIEEAQNRLARCNQSIVEKRDYWGSCRRCGACPVYGCKCSIPNGKKMVCLGSDIWIGTTRRVEKAVELTVKAGNICWYNGILVGRSRKIVTKASSSCEIISIVPPTAVT
jgi:hypothetical protein